MKSNSSKWCNNGWVVDCIRSRCVRDVLKEFQVQCEPITVAAEPRRKLVTVQMSADASAVKQGRPKGTIYRGDPGMWSWVFHRITGVAIFFFLLVHVLDTALIRVSPEAYNAVIGTYQTPIMGLRSEER